MMIHKFVLVDINRSRQDQGRCYFSLSGKIKQGEIIPMGPILFLLLYSIRSFMLLTTSDIYQKMIHELVIASDRPFNVLNNSKTLLMFSSPQQLKTMSSCYMAFAQA